MLNEVRQYIKTVRGTEIKITVGELERELRYAALFGFVIGSVLMIFLAKYVLGL